ncbi:MAG: hypothetical protein RIT25_2319, partial [Planctomycetota bacterium]
MHTPRPCFPASRRSTYRALALLALGALAPGLAAQCAPQWQPGDGVPGVIGGSTVVRAVTNWDPDGAGPITPKIVVGGIFSFVGTIAASNIAAFDPATGTWSALGSGTNNEVRALAVLPNGDLVAGGNFTSAGGVACSRMARWNGTAWAPLASSVDGTVAALAVSPGGDLLAGGTFRTVGGVTVNMLARWDGTTWSAVGGGTLATINAIWSILTLANGDLVVGGQFTSIGATVANNIARWYGTTWSALGAGTDAAVHALAL